MGTTRIDVKPLSVNQVWQGRRFKTPNYKKYESLLLSELPDDVVIPDGPIKIILRWGFSNNQSDWDNPIKPFVDVLQKKYDFNDKWIYYAVVIKELVPKGEEFIEFTIEEYDIDTKREIPSH